MNGYEDGTYVVSLFPLFSLELLSLVSSLLDDVSLVSVSLDELIDSNKFNSQDDKNKVDNKDEDTKCVDTSSDNYIK